MSLLLLVAFAATSCFRDGYSMNSDAFVKKKVTLFYNSSRI